MLIGSSLARFLLVASLGAVAAPLATGFQDDPGDEAKDRAARRQSAEFQREVNDAIDRGVLWLRKRQNRDGSFTGQHAQAYRAGETALCAYTIAQSGGRLDDQVMLSALDYLRAHPPTKTYSAGVTLLLLAEMEEGGKDPLAEETLEKIIDWERSDPRGTWGYPGGRIDLSNVQFAALGLWAGHRMGLDVPIPLCQRVVETTVERYQEEPRDASLAIQEASSRKGRSRAGKAQVAGFTYEMNHGEPRGSMTVAGICVNRIMERIHGRKLGRKALNLIAPSERLAMAWLEENLSFTENPAVGRGRAYYYLWGVERMAALMGVEKLWGRDWFQEGARHILDKQKGDGSWENNLHETCFAILFLARATQGGRVSSGDGNAPASLLSDEGPVRIRVTGSWHLRGWVESIEGEASVHKVEWYLNDEVFAESKGDPTRPWKSQRFAFEKKFTRQQDAVLVARVHLVDPEAEPGEPGSAEDPDLIESKPLRVPIEWDPADWLRKAQAVPRPTSIPMERGRVRASSEKAGHPIGNVLDGLEGTNWRAEPEDAQPVVSFSFNRSTKVSGVTVSQAAASPAAVGGFRGVTRIKVTVNGDDEYLFDVADQSPARIELPFPRRARIKTLEIQMLEFADGPGAERGFAEIVLR